MTNHAESIRAAREAAGYTRASLSCATGIGEQQIVRIEAGRDLRAHELGSLCRVLPLDPLVILGMGGACTEGGGWCEVDSIVAPGGVCGGGE